MRPSGKAPHLRRVAYLSVTALACATLLVAGGCKSRNAPIVQFTDAPVATGTVEAPLSVQPSATAEGAVSSTDASGNTIVTPETQGAPSGGGVAEAPVGKTATANKNAIWPTKVATYKLNVKWPAWFPKSVPAGYKIDSLNIVEMDPRSGLVCDIVWLKDGKVLQLMQGSPKNRSYPIQSSGKTKWGSFGMADLVKQDPSDPAAPVVIVFSNGGSFAELSGDVPLTQLKAVAASMIAVK